MRLLTKHSWHCQNFWYPGVEGNNLPGSQQLPFSRDLLGERKYPFDAPYVGIVIVPRGWSTLQASRADSEFDLVNFHSFRSLIKQIIIDLSGKTSLLLQLAYNLALDDLARVVFICKRENFENDHIYVSPGVNTASEVFERVYIKYIKSDEDLRKFFAAFHLYPKLPTAVIVDDFVDFFGDSFGYRQGGFKIQASRDANLVKTLSLCQNAIGYANDKAGTGIKCRLIMSDSHPRDGPRLLYIFKRWMSQIYVIKGLKASSRFSLGLQHIGTGGIGDVVGRFTLANPSLRFDGLEAREE